MSLFLWIVWAWIAGIGGLALLFLGLFYSKAEDRAAYISGGVAGVILAILALSVYYIPGFCRPWF